MQNKAGQFLGGGVIAPEVAGVAIPAQVSVMEAALPPTVGPRSIQLLNDAKPKGHFGINGAGSFTIVHGGQTWDNYDPSNEEQMKEELSKGFPLVIFGIGAGNLLFRVRTVCQAVRGTVPPILVYEPDPGVLKSFLGVRFPLQGVSVCCDVDDFRQMLQVLLGGVTSLTIFHSGDYVMSPEAAEKRGPHAQAMLAAYENFSDVVRRIVDAEQVTVNTITVRMREWVRNVAVNLDAISGCVPAMRLAGEFTGVPVFIVGAGPSLNKNGHLLKECARKGIVITVDVAAKAFVKHGAEPHLFLAVEGRDLSEHLDGVDWINTVPRAFSLEANPAVLRCGSGPLLPWADSNFPFNGVNMGLLGVEGLPIGGSVTTAAFLFGEAFGCNPLIMVGQDLANTGGMRAADGVLADKLHPLEEHGEVQAWGDPSATVKDTPQWLHARVWFEQRAAALRKRDTSRVLFNCTEGGSHVEGFEDKPLADVLAMLPDRDIDMATVLEDFQPVWSDGVSWFKTRTLAALPPIATAARELADVCERVATVVAAGEDSDAAPLMAERGVRETTYRTLAGPHHLFTGWTQRHIVALSDLRKATSGKELVGEEAAKFFSTEAGIFRDMATGADELADVMTRGLESSASVLPVWMNYEGQG